MARVEERVARGVAWLDEHRSGWEKIIDLPKFDIVSTCNCVLGQVFAKNWSNDRYENTYDWAMEEFNLWGVDEELGFDAQVAPEVPDSVWVIAFKQDYIDLQAEWERVIKERFDTGVLSDAE